jgi:hypothetical protein
MEPCKEQQEIVSCRRITIRKKKKMAAINPNKSQQKKTLDNLLDKYSERLIYLTELLQRTAHKKRSSRTLET